MKLSKKTESTIKFLLKTNKNKKFEYPSRYYKQKWIYANYGIFESR